LFIPAGPEEVEEAASAAEAAEEKHVYAEQTRNKVIRIEPIKVLPDSNRPSRKLPLAISFLGASIPGPQGWRRWR